MIEARVEVQSVPDRCEGQAVRFPSSAAASGTKRVAGTGVEEPAELEGLCFGDF
ncbi:hypothetical protein [Paenibacillus eucommiae]|uniref:Uncharacterized protein n=1 Tax=Paenibacillus eucommiae TaxID=1355755 RepID=A0ABS4ITI7_9BACL|nr:hypothetical protein [Paenibacillus eucommiae]MBP1990885.1 hypothetical protein [Paenibacillus eucommiae]